MECDFITADGERLVGTIVHYYSAFEGGMRYIFRTADGKNYRCVAREDGEFVEYKC